MQSYSRAHLTNDALLAELSERIGQDRSSLADLLAVIAEVDERRLYLPAGYSSMFTYCVGKLQLSEDSAYKRIQAARAARSFPAIFEAVADGRLHLTAIVLLKPHLNEASVEDLMAAATGKSKMQIKRLLAERFPYPDVRTMVRALPLRAAPALSKFQLVPEPVAALRANAPSRPLAEPQKPFAAPPPKPIVEPLAPRRYALHLTMSQEMHDDLRHAKELLSHAVPFGDEAAVIHRSLKTLIGQLEKAKYALTSAPREAGPVGTSRHIPAHVRRSVFERDGGQCTFVSDDGHRCESRSFLEFDHIQEIARGGEATIENLRLRCRAHNQYAAELAFGKKFMEKKRTARA